MKMKKLSKEELLSDITITLPAISWMGALGNLCLALRHPQNTGPTRLITLTIVKMIESSLLAKGLVDTEDIKLLHNTKQAFSGIVNLQSKN